MKKINFAIEASNANDNYMIGLRNGMRYCLALIDGKEPEFENCNQDSTKNNQGWIPVTERLPEEESIVLINTKAGNVMQGLYKKRYGFGMKEGFICSDCFMYLESVTAWQPLPEAYKPAEQKKTIPAFAAR